MLGLHALFAILFVFIYIFALVVNADCDAAQ